MVELMRKLKKKSLMDDDDYDGVLRRGRDRVMNDNVYDNDDNDGIVMMRTIMVLIAVVVKILQKRKITLKT